MDIEKILYTFEDDYNPSSMVPGPRNMYDDERMGFGRGLKVLNKTERKNILNWGKNTSNGEWSSEKTFKEYDKASRDKKTKIRLGVTTGVGSPGFKKKGDVKPLTKEQQKLWDATMADTAGKWEDYGNANRGNWLRDVDQKLDRFKQTKNLLSRKELGDFLTKKIGIKFDKNKIFGRRYSLVSGENKSKFGQFVDDKLFAMEFADGQQKYYKKPTDAQIKFIKENLLQNVQKNSLNTNTLNTIKKIDKLYGPIYKSGNLPNLKSMMKKLNLTGNQIAYAEAQLARIYGGHKFVNGPDIRVNNKTANSMFDIIAKSEFGNPRKTQVYELSLDLIDEGLGNEKGTFRNLKNKALQILKDNKIDVYDPKKGKKAFGFNIDELAGVTGSGKSKNMAVSQFINVMEGNLNTKELQSFQAGLSKARTAVEGAKGTPFYSRVLKEQMERINTRALGLEKKHGIKLARLQKPADINNMTAKEVKRLKNINLGTGEDLYQRLVKDAKASGYSIKMPKDTLTIQEFVDPKNIDQVKTMLADLGCPKSLQKASGGRIKYSKGTSCAIKGRAVLEKGLTNGFDKTEGDLAKKILQAGRGLGNMFALRNLLGPAAIGFTVAAEAGLVGFDMLASGKSFREAVGDSLFNYALGDKTKIDSDEERYKRYASLGYDADKIRNYENTMDRINEIGFQYDDLYGKANAVNIGGPKRSDAIKQKQQIISDKALAEIPAFSQDLYRTGEIPRLEEYVQNNFASGADEIRRADQEALIQQKESGGPKFMGMVFPKFEEGRQQDILNAQGILGYKPPSSTVSHFMSNLSEGGIASLNVKK